MLLLLLRLCVVISRLTVKCVCLLPLITLFSPVRSSPFAHQSVQRLHISSQRKRKKESIDRQLILSDTVRICRQIESSRAIRICGNVPLHICYKFYFIEKEMFRIASSKLNMKNDIITRVLGNCLFVRCSRNSMNGLTKWNINKHLACVKGEGDHGGANLKNTSTLHDTRTHAQNKRIATHTSTIRTAQKRFGYTVYIVCVVCVLQWS